MNLPDFNEVQKVKDIIQPLGWDVFTFQSKNIYGRSIGIVWVGMKNGYPQLEASSSSELISEIEKRVDVPVVKKSKKSITVEEEKEMWALGEI